MFYLYPQLLQPQEEHVSTDMYTYESGSNTRFTLYNSMQKRRNNRKTGQLIGYFLQTTTGLHRSN